MTSPSADRRKVSCDDALEFLVALKEGLDPDKYEEFLDTMVDMKEQRFDIVVFSIVLFDSEIFF